MLTRLHVTLVTCWLGWNKWIPMCTFWDPLFLIGRWMNWTKQLVWQAEILPCMALMSWNLNKGGDGPALPALRYHIWIVIYRSFCHYDTWHRYIKSERSFTNYVILQIVGLCSSLCESWVEFFLIVEPSLILVLHQIANVKRAVVAGKEQNAAGTTSASGMRRELMRMPNSHQPDRSLQYSGARDNDDFISSESDRQTLLIK